MTRHKSWGLVLVAAVAIGTVGAGGMMGAGAAMAQKGKGGGKPAGPKAPTPAPAPAVNIDVAAVRADLLSADADRAAAAAQKLGSTKQTGALTALLDALALGVHPRVAAVALSAVGNHADARAVDVLMYYATNRNPDVRAAAVLGLGTVDDKRARVAVAHAFTDGEKNVRAAACKVAETRKDRSSAGALIALLEKGDEATVPALAAIASPELARRLGELVGNAPDGLLAETLGMILLRPDLGKEEVYVQVVEVIGKIPGEEAVVALTNYVSATPEKPPRLSRRRAQELAEQRLSGDD